MRRLLCVVCLCFSLTSVGCFKFLDDVRNDNGRMSKMGASSKARQIENDLDFGLNF